jgi:hypothetical protein
VTRPGLLLFVLVPLSATLSAAALAQAPVAPPPVASPVAATAPAPPPIIGEAPIVAGNSATAKARALDDAFRQTVERSFTALAAEGGGAAMPPALAQLRASLFGRARRYVRSYRIVDQREEGGRFKVQVEAEVDEGLLRRDIDRARGPGATPPPARVATGPALLVAGSPPEAVSVLARALGAAGFRADTPPLPPGDEARARDVAARTGAAGAALVSASVNGEGPVRGTGKTSASCRLAVRVLSSAGTAPADRGTETRAFADGEEAARSDCLARAAAELAPQIGASVSGGGSAAPGMHLVTLDIDLVEPAALPLLLQAVRKTGSTAEIRRVTVGHVELRVTTGLAVQALASAMTRELGSAATVTPGAVLADRMALQVRLSTTELAPPP